jgi:hypothetical protein
LDRPLAEQPVLERFTLLFPLWTLLAVALALPFPGLFTWLQGPLIVLALALIMLGMGLELQWADFQRVLRRPAPAALGVLAQYLVMPALAALVAWVLRLPPPLAVGLILVGCCPGGTASNVVCLIARADVALSVVMTSISTLAAVLLTPLLTGWLAGRYVPVDGWKLLLDVLQVVVCRRWIRRRFFPFPLDPFQLEAIDALNQGHSVVVSAPTGSGKTLVGEYAIHRAMAHGRKVFYTTPLKALSNQKLRDFREQFGPEKVGLLTGDMSLNREAQVVVMTTEIFRNMLYAEIDHPDNDPLEGVEAVVLDECHYMNDSQRGTVWEESIIHCPPAIQLVALSATVANAGQLTDWIEAVHGPTQLVHSDHRPVPLAFSFCSAKGLHPLLNEAGTDLHPNCKVWRAPKGNRRKGPKVPKPPQPEAPPLGFVVAQMAERDMLPAIYFIFSRRGCDKGVRDLGKLCLVTRTSRPASRPGSTPLWPPARRRCARATTNPCCAASPPTTPACCRPGRS